ncbi:MAG TPA: helix-turn-helix domain-containing protein [Polyangiaceae bacterium]|nr:helix-turn-helix domain-containing protein [Polyangiaceae bacterium]
MSACWSSRSVGRRRSKILPGAPPFVESDDVSKVRSVASRLAASDLPILISGEIGTGRRTLAQALATIRARGQLPINVVSVVDGLPDEARIGRTDASVLVLHHLHLLGERGQTEIAGLIRERRTLIVATSSLDENAITPELSALIDATRVSLPPLRDRNDDILSWADVFVARAAAELGRSASELSGAARRALSAHSWPGNLSELDSVIRRAVLLGQQTIIEPEDLGFHDSFVVQSLNDAVDEFRMTYVRRVLAHFDGNRTQAARALGIDARTMFRYLAKAKDTGA